MVNSKLIYSKRGGGKLGPFPLFKWWASYPFSKLIIENDEIILKVFPFKKRIKTKDISYISETYLRGIKINLKNDVFSYCIFYPFNKKEVIDAFKRVRVKYKKDLSF